MSKKTLRERIKEAERAVEKAQEILDRAESELEELEADQKRETTRDVDALVAARTGPQEPVGSRTVRRSCPLAEIPKWFAAAMLDRRMEAVEWSGRKFATNGHVAIDVETAEGLTKIGTSCKGIFDLVGGRRLRRHDVPVMVGSTPCRRTGRRLLDLRYASLVEDLFPGVKWVGFGEARDLQPIHAVVDGHIVAVVMPVRGP